VLSLSPNLRVFAATAPTDMRKSFSGLVGLVEKELDRQVEAGGLFLFFSRRRNAVKVLFFTGDGLAIFYRRLERGTFELPRTAATADAKGIELKLSELTLILEGIELSSVKHRRRWSQAARTG
jgi:transposase